MTLEEWKGANAKRIFKNSFREDLKTVENFLPGQVLDALVHRISRYRAKSNVVGRINVTTEVLYRWWSLYVDIIDMVAMSYLCLQQSFE